MKNVLKVDFQKKTIIMDRTFAKNCADTRSEEYAHLQRVRADYPIFTVTTRSCKPNPEKESYRGLTYAYMEDYIITREGKDSATYKEFLNVKKLSQIQAGPYAYVKSWFLKKYKDEFEKEEETAEAKKPDLKLVSND